jgi:1,5-anhydro-D-fructose reductase (1,5-anhydro-D-mannitol-forming)
MDTVRWGIIGCGEVTEVKSGPGFQKASNSALVAVMRRDREKAEDYARRHRVPRVHTSAQALIEDPAVDAVYIATPPSSHHEITVAAAAAGKPCLVEKPMALNHAECVQMVDAFRRARVPLWVAYYRRALPRFLLLRQLLRDGAIGSPTSVHVEVLDRLATGDQARNWRFDRRIAGAGLFFDLASHCFDLVDFLIGPITHVSGFAVNSGESYAVEDVTSAAFRVDERTIGSGIWNFNAGEKRDRLTLIGSSGELGTSVFADDDVIVRKDGRETVHPVRNPPHVHQPLIQTIVDEMLGRGQCESTGESGARTSWVLDRCVEGYYGAGR